MSFGWAIKWLKGNHKVSREKWNGSGVYLKLQVPDEKSKMSFPYIYAEYSFGSMCYPDGCRFPWNPNNEDVLADDWFEVA